MPLPLSSSCSYTTNRSHNIQTNMLQQISTLTRVHVCVRVCVDASVCVAFNYCFLPICPLLCCCVAFVKANSSVRDMIILPILLHSTQHHVCRNINHTHTDACTTHTHTYTRLLPPKTPCSFSCFFFVLWFGVFISYMLSSLICCVWFVLCIICHHSIPLALCVFGLVWDLFSLFFFFLFVSVFV